MVLTGKRPISDRIANELARALVNEPGFGGWTAQKWMDLQRSYLEWSKSRQQMKDAWMSRANRVGILCDAGIEEAASVGALGIEPFDRMFVQPASYDLKAGTLEWFGRFENGQRRMATISQDATALIVPGDRVRVVAKEKISMPDNLVARLAAVGALVWKGVSCVFGIQLEPGWVGHPFFTLSHQGDEDIEIGPDDPVVSVEFHFLPQTPESPMGKDARETNLPQRNSFTNAAYSGSPSSSPTQLR